MTDATGNAPLATPLSATVSPADAPASAEARSQDAWTNRRASEQATRAANARQVSGRRRFVDPTTCDRDYSGEEMEFMHAMQDYKKRSGRMFPTWSEVLEVIRELGYEKDESAVAGHSGARVASAG